MDIRCYREGNGDAAWRACNYDETIKAYGTTPLVAAMRCYVASKLGDEVDVPVELINEGEIK